MTIQVFRPTLGQDELLAVADSFNTGWIGKGRKVDEFEAAWAGHIGAKPENVVSANSCTEGLFQAVQLLGIGLGDEVIIPTIHFVGAAQAVLDVGARPVFCDVDSRTLNTTAEHLHRKITWHTKAIILNHYGGVACPMDEIMLLLEQWVGIYLIEDCACAPASTFNGQAVGTFGDIGVWSFDSMKIISTGDGGMMWIRNKELADKAGKQLYLGTSTASGLSSDKDRWWEFEVEIEGARRSVMNDLAAGIGLEQLKKLDDFGYRRATIYDYYDTGLEDCPIDLPPKYYHKPSYYFYWIQTPQRDELAKFLRAADIYCTFRYYPLHWVFKTGQSLPGAEQAARETLLLPLHQGLSDSDVEYVCEKVREFYG